MLRTLFPAIFFLIVIFYNYIICQNTIFSVIISNINKITFIHLATSLIIPWCPLNICATYRTSYPLYWVKESILWYRRLLIISLHIWHRSSEKKTKLSVLQDKLYSFSLLVANVQACSKHMLSIVFVLWPTPCVFLCSSPEIPQPKPLCQWSSVCQPAMKRDLASSLFYPRGSLWFASILIWLLYLKGQENK